MKHLLIILTTILLSGNITLPAQPANQDEGFLIMFEPDVKAEDVLSKNLFLQDGELIIVEYFEYVNIWWVQHSPQNNLESLSFDLNSRFFCLEKCHLTDHSNYTLDYSPNSKSGSSYRLNAVSLNTLNYSSILSINYERLFALHHLGSGKGYISLLTGLGFSGTEPLQRPQKVYLSLPHHLTYLVGFDPLRFEAGLGASIIYGKSANYFGIAGLRLHSLKDHKIQLRIFVQIPVAAISEELFVTRIGGGIGFNF